MLVSTKTKCDSKTKRKKNNFSDFRVSFFSLFSVCVCVCLKDLKKETCTDIYNIKQIKNNKQTWWLRCAYNLFLNNLGSGKLRTHTYSIHTHTRKSCFHKNVLFVFYCKAKGVVKMGSWEKSWNTFWQRPPARSFSAFTAWVTYGSYCT